MKKEFQAGTKDEQRTTDDISTLTSVAASPLLSAVLPCQVKFKGDFVQLKSIDRIINIAIIRIKHAGYWHDYDKKVLLSDLEPVKEHIHDIDSFNKCCQTCGLYCG